MQILVKNGLCVTMDSQGHIYEGFDLLIEDDVISRIAPAIPGRADKVVDATDKLLIPGFVNAHLHSYDAFMKGLYESMVLEVWFPNASLAVRRPLAPHEIYVRTLLVATEMLNSGITTAYDDVTLVPLSQESVHAVMTAYRDAGLRAVVGTSVLNKPFTETMPYLHEIMPDDVRQKADGGPMPPDSDIVDICRWMIETWNGQEGRLHVALAPSAPQRCTDDFMLAMHDLSEQYGVPWNTHVLETKVQAVTGPEFYGKTIVEHLADLGLLSDRLSLIHGVWLKDRDMRLVAEAGTSVVHNPVSNAKIGSGIAPIRKMLEAGVNVALGTDNRGAVDTVSMFDAIKFAALLPELAGPAYGEWEPSREILRAATRGGARSTLLEDTIGSLEVGKKADIVILDLNSHPFVPLNDPVRQLVYGESGQSIDSVLVNGRLVMEGKRLLTVDESAILEEAKEIGLSLREEDVKAREFAESLRPYLEQMYWRCVAQDVGICRYSGLAE